MLKTKLLYLFALFVIICSNTIIAQEPEVVVSEDFSIRDFIISKDSIFYIKKRTACLYEKKTKSNKCFFIGGYGIKLNTKEHSNTVITVSNELVDTVCSVRFYNKKKDKFEAEYYYKKGKILDYLNIPEASLFVLSLTNNKIIFVDYQERPKFHKIIEIKQNSFCRKLIYKNNILYFATDNGNVYKYNFHSYKKTLLYSANKLITEFTINDSTLIYTTIEGDISKVNLDSKTKTNVKIKNNFISTILLTQNKLICGSWNGRVYILDNNKFTIEKELNIHKRAILKIKKYDKKIYSSSLDNTIKSWELN